MKLGSGLSKEQMDAAEGEGWPVFDVRFWDVDITGCSFCHKLEERFDAPAEPGDIYAGQADFFTDGLDFIAF